MELEEPDLAFGEHAAALGGLLLQPEQAVDAQGESVALPDGPHGRRRNANADEAELAADADIAVGGELLGHLQDALFQFRRGLVGHPRATPRLRRQALGPILLVSLFNLVEVAPADAGTLAGQPDVVEFLGQGQKPEPGLDKLFSGAHEAVSSFRGDLSLEKPKIYHRNAASGTAPALPECPLIPR